MPFEIYKHRTLSFVYRFVSSENCSIFGDVLRTLLRVGVIASFPRKKKFDSDSNNATKDISNMNLGFVKYKFCVCIKVDFM